jgi:distribution and morphology protein 31
MPKSVQEEFRLGIQEKEPNVVSGDLLAGVELDEDEIGQKRLNKMPWFDLTIESLEVELSLMRLMEGKGLVKCADVKGVRGIVDNRRGNWNRHIKFDYEAIRKSHIPGNFELDRLTINDLSIFVYMPTGFRPFPISILQGQLSKFRKQW